LRKQSRRIIAAVAAILLTVSLSVGVAVARESTDALFERIRTVYDVAAGWHKDGADAEKFTAGAIKGGLEALGDPYTNYFTDEEYKGFLESLNGVFYGIGAYLEQDGNFVVVASPIKNSPAARAGLQTGDRLLEADGRSLMGLTAETAVQYIRGEAGTSVVLKVERPSENRTMTLTITRELIDLPEVEGKMLADGIGHITISRFGDTAVRTFYSTVEELKSQGAKGLVLDIRQNGGGYVNGAIDIASAFLPAGKTVLWEVGKQGKSEFKSSGRLINLPTVVLVDGGSASASEILAGALQDHKVAPLVGTKTFGKGTVQQLLSLSIGGAMKVTVAEYLTPNERHVHKIGLKPDYVVEPLKQDLERTAPLELKRPLFPNRTGLDVLYLQYRLEDLGYSPETTGYFGLNTSSAVKRFAAENGLAAETAVSQQFVDVLNQKVAARAREAVLEDVQLNKAVELVKAKMTK